MNRYLSPDEISAHLFPAYADVVDERITAHDSDTAEPWTKTYCAEWSKFALPLAQIAFASTDLQVTRVLTFEPRRHHYLIAEDQLTYMREPYIMCGTWQQFPMLRGIHLDDSFPRILSGTPSQIQPVLERAGISENFQRIWLDPALRTPHNPAFDY